MKKNYVLIIVSPLLLVGGYFEIFNILGQRVSSINFENKQILSINTNSISNGIYFFKIKTDSIIKSAKFKIIKE